MYNSGDLCAFQWGHTGHHLGLVQCTAEQNHKTICSEVTAKDVGKYCYHLT